MSKIRPQPRSFTASDDELGIASPPEFGRHPVTGQTVGRLPSRPAPGTDPMNEDWIAQNVIAGTPVAGASRLIAPAVGRALGPALTRVALPAGEGAAVSASAGGDPRVGALLGAALGAPAAVGAIRQHGVAANIPGASGAAARVQERIGKDIVRGDGEGVAAKKTADKVTARAGEDNAVLMDRLESLPELKQTLATEAYANPAKGQKAARASLDELTPAQDAVYGAIQKQYGGVGLGDVVQLVNKVAQDARKAGKAVTQDAADAVTADLLARFGHEGKWTPDMKLTAEQIRNIRNDMGAIAFKANPLLPQTAKGEALTAVYGAFNEAIENVAAKTKGVDVKAFKNRNQQISTLIDVEQALAERAAGQARGQTGLKETIQALAPVIAGSQIAGIEGGLYGLGAYGLAKGGAKLGRLIDYNLAEALAGQSPVPPVQSRPAVGIGAGLAGQDR